MHIKGRLLDQAVILFNWVPFHGNSSERKEVAPRGSKFFPLRAIPYGMENLFYHIRCHLLNVTIFITHMPNCVMGAKPMGCEFETHYRHCAVSLSFVLCLVLVLPRKTGKFPHMTEKLFTRMYSINTNKPRMNIAWDTRRKYLIETFSMSTNTTKMSCRS